MTATKKIYKIRDRDTGLHSTGGMDPKWTKNGKAWPSAGALRSHLTQWADMHQWDPVTKNRKLKKIPASWEIIEFEVVTAQK